METEKNSPVKGLAFLELLNKKLLNHAMNTFTFPMGDDLRKKLKIIELWQKALKDSDLERTKETSIQGQFLDRFFGDVLGYVRVSEGQGYWNLVQHPRSEADARVPDGAIGVFCKDKSITRGVIELKNAKTPLDKRQTSRRDNRTPIQQAYSYVTSFDRCDWIIVSNFKEIRLYSKQRTPDYYERFEVLCLLDEQEFRRFYYILSKDNLVSADGNSLIDQLSRKTYEQQTSISQEFYKDYKSVQQLLFEHLVKENPEVLPVKILEKTNKLLDRLVFVFFCEEAGNLLPANTAKKTYDRGRASFAENDERIWREFKGLFRAIDQGNQRVNPPICQYNGGLFALDEELDSLVLLDTIWKPIIELSNYDFDSDINVNILGHIFEQSLSDRERRKAKWSDSKDKPITPKRKREGIYYTPEFITRFMVEQTVGTYLQEFPDKISSIKILDPACGSGAFLNQAHSFLLEQYRIRHAEQIAHKSQLSFDDLNIAETDRSILLNNLYGVDLNQESVEITKLSLWLKTARRQEPLQNLERNIRCGDSLVDDPEFAGDKHFCWNQEFAEIMESGGFDVVIGNPPYVRQEFFSPIKPYLAKHYTVYTGSSDLYVYFFERGLTLLKDGGYFSFIVSNKFLKTHYGQKLTHYLQTNYSIVHLIDFGDLQIFGDATTYPCIITIKKEKPHPIQTFPYLRVSNLDYTDLNAEMDAKGKTVEISSSQKGWILEDTLTRMLVEKLKTSGTPLGEFVDHRIFSGLKTGRNEAFVIDEKDYRELIAKDPASVDILRPFLAGRNIKRFSIDWDHTYMILAKDGLDIPKLYPAIFEHLEKHEQALKKRWDKGESWYHLRPCSYYEHFQEAKLVCPDISTEPNFTVDSTGKYVLGNTAYSIGSDSLFLLGVLNSRVTAFFYKQMSPTVRGGFMRFTNQYLKQIPIPLVSPKVQGELAEKVQQILDTKREFENSLLKTRDFLCQECHIDTLSQKLLRFYTLGWNEFFEELESKSKTKERLSQRAYWHSWFTEQREVFVSQRCHLLQLEEDLDQFIYTCWNLTKEEKQILTSYKRA